MKGNRLTKVQRKLIEIGVAFDYLEREDAVYLTFQDALGKEHTVKEDRSEGLLLTRNGFKQSNQAEICGWIDKNITLLTDYKAIMEEREKEREAREYAEYRTEIIDVKKYEYKDYELTVRINRVGLMYPTIKVMSENRFLPQLIVKDKRFYSESDGVFVQTSSFGALDISSTKDYMSGVGTAIQAAEYFAAILFGDKEEK